MHNLFSLCNFPMGQHSQSTEYLAQYMKIVNRHWLQRSTMVIFCIISTRFVLNGRLAISKMHCLLPCCSSKSELSATSHRHKVVNGMFLVLKYHCCQLYLIFRSYNCCTLQLTIFENK